jgi:hypothetical protein
MSKPASVFAFTSLALAATTLYFWQELREERALTVQLRDAARPVFRVAPQVITNAAPAQETGTAQAPPPAAPANAAAQPPPVVVAAPVFIGSGTRQSTLSLRLAQMVRAALGTMGRGQ